MSKKAKAAQSARRSATYHSKSTKEKAELNRKRGLAIAAGCALRNANKAKES